MPEMSYEHSGHLELSEQEAARRYFAGDGDGAASVMGVPW